MQCVAVMIQLVSQDHVQWLKKTETWQNDRVYVKIVLYWSVTPLSEGKMVVNE